MNLVIQAHTLKSEPLSHPITGRFDERGGTIGRSDTNTLSLPDPERHISRLQAEITFSASSFGIRNVGSANPILINARSLAPGEQSPIGEGDELVIGSYSMRVHLNVPSQVRLAERPPADSRTVATASKAPPTAIDAPGQTAPGAARITSASPPPFSLDAGVTHVDLDPFSKPLDMGQAPPELAGFIPSLAEAVGLGAPPRGTGLPPPPQRASMVPDSLLGLAVASPPPAPAPRPFSDPKGPAPRRLPPVPPEPAETTTPAMRVARSAPGADPMNSSPAPLAGAHIEVDVSPATAIDIASPESPNAPAVTGTVETYSSTSPQVLWAAFCEGADIACKPGEAPSPETMLLLGQVFHRCVEGILKLAAARTSTKADAGVEVTRIQKSNNNPMKFAPDTGAAIERLIQPPMRGFVSGTQAVDEVMDDLISHAVGTHAGMMAALSGLLEQFEPFQLESRLGGKGVMDSLVPMNRSAKLWNLYLQHFERIQQDAKQDFHTLFGDAFNRAYEAQQDAHTLARQHPSRKP